MFCGKCGTERNNENARFCRACGAAFHTSPPQPTSLAQPMREQLEGLGEATAVRAVDVAGLPAEQRTGPTGPNPSAVDRDKAEPPAERAGHIAHPLDEWTSGQPSPIRQPWEAAREQTPAALGTISAPTQARLPFLLAALGLLLVGGIVGFVAVTWLLPL